MISYLYKIIEKHFKNVNRKQENTMILGYRLVFINSNNK